LARKSSPPLKLIWNKPKTFLAITFDLCIENDLKNICKKTKQWPLAGEFSEFEYLPKIRRFWRVLEFAKTSDPPNFYDSRRRIWRVLSKFSKFSKFGEFGEFGEGNLDRCIPKSIFFLT
jgi:hypothetical protein